MSSSSGHRIFDHTADVGVEAWGPSLEDALAEGARGLFGLLCDLEAVSERTEVQLAARGADEVERAVHLLQEALAAWHVDRLVLCRFEVSLAGDAVRARAWGEPYDADRHLVEGELKAVTYHQAAVRRTATGWLVRYIVDI